MDEKQAIAQLKRGDLRGLEVLVSLHYLKAARAVFMIVGGLEVAEDIVQNAFVRIIDKISQFDVNKPFEPWFLKSVVNDAIKASTRKKSIVRLDASDEKDGSIDLSDPTPLPEELVESQETRQAVWSAIEKLPPKQRAAIILRYYLGMSEDEMVEKLHGPTGTIKWWLHAAKQHMKRLLQIAEVTDPSPIKTCQLKSGNNRESE